MPHKTQSIVNAGIKQSKLERERGGGGKRSKKIKKMLNINKLINNK